MIYPFLKWERVGSGVIRGKWRSWYVCRWLWGFDGENVVHSSIAGLLEMIVIVQTYSFMVCRMFATFLQTYPLFSILISESCISSGNGTKHVTISKCMRTLKKWVNLPKVLSKANRFTAYLSICLPAAWHDIWWKVKLWFRTHVATETGQRSVQERFPVHAKGSVPLLCSGYSHMGTRWKVSTSTFWSRSKLWHQLKSVRKWAIIPRAYSQSHCWELKVKG